MLFNSYHFMLFFPIVVLLYFAIPKKLRYIWLLLASYYFYMSWNPKYALLMLISTVITYLSGFGIAYCDQKGGPKALKNKKMVVAVSFLTNISILMFFKYFNFLLENFYVLLQAINIQVIEKSFDVLLPVGISFYTFQALSYTMDVYRGEVKAEHNFLKYALFVSFFPQLVAGPIERSSNLLSQVNEVPLKKLMNYDRIASGLTLMLWGYFQKMVIADRIAIMVNQVFDSYYMYGTVELLLAAMGFALQIYCDFASYSTIAIGAARVMGFTLMENFDTPYFATSIKDFWRRWHISLSTWFKDYLYIPLGGSRYGRMRRHVNILITFLVSGLWHGANWTYILWGGVHGLYQILGYELQPYKKRINERLKTKTDSFSYRFGQTVVTFILVDFAWIFFRADTLKDAVYYISRMFRKHDFWTFFDGSLYELGLDRCEVNILCFSILILLLIDLIKLLKGLRIDEFLAGQCIWFRWCVLIVLIWCVIIFGKYGPNVSAAQFIYFQF